MDAVWGIDLGGTKIEGVILENKAELNVLKRLRVPTEAHLGYNHIIKQVVKLMEVLSSEIGIKPRYIGIGTPGVLDPITGLMKNCNTSVLNDKAFNVDLEKALKIPVKIANDANCFAVAEANLGIVKKVLPNAKVVFGVIMGTGVGGGLVVNKEVINGRQGIAGEWGHNFLHDSGGDCYCGNYGCVETIISGPSLEGFYESIMGIPRKLPEIVERYHNGKDDVAKQTIDRLIKYFGKSMANVINIVDPDAIVIGGGVGNINLLYTKGVEEVKKHVFNNQLDTLFLKPSLGDSAGVFGAALL